MGLIDATAEHVRAACAGESSGHDWWHIQRVWNTARMLCAGEPGADPTVVELAALLHDIADAKFHDGDETIGARTAAAWLRSLGAPEDVVARVADIVANVSYKGAGIADKVTSLEQRVVQDADRLDAIGAIGIGRAFAYGGWDNRVMHDPDEPPVLHETIEAYRAARGTTVNHFHEKLLLLGERMLTDTGRRIAQERIAYMEAFLERFHAEWDGRA
ncbi:MAG: Metal-dependent phosphohydrolase, subdomain [Solirubrobacterales bacterium]|nr:Metal-dependent phosphohydrolase, subdomain [Solirubrobacterales bacterium]